jgi:hypothetical protein
MLSPRENISEVGIIYHTGTEWFLPTRLVTLVADDAVPVVPGIPRLVPD